MPFDRSTVTLERLSLVNAISDHRLIEAKDWTREDAISALVKVEEAFCRFYSVALTDFAWMSDHKNYELAGLGADHLACTMKDARSDVLMTEGD